MAACTASMLSVRIVLIACCWIGSLEEMNVSMRSLWVLGVNTCG